MIMLTTEIVIYIALTLLGLCFGSFAGATVWRLRARQLVADKAAGEEFDKKELKRLLPLTKKSFANDRSRCLHCGYELHWYDLVPLLSWLSIGGKCRNCRKPIGYFEPLIELGVAAFFVLSYVFWPVQIIDPITAVQFGLWLVAGVLFAMLFAYDAKWFLLPDVINISLAVVGALYAATVVIQSADIVMVLLNILGSVGIMSGLYLLLYLASKGNWIGFGDVKLGLGLGLLLADWRLAFLALFAANLIGCLIVIPGLLSGKLKAKSHVPFGPLLIVGTILAVLFGLKVIELYFSALI